MSPSKSRQQFVPTRPRAEVFTAIAVGAAIVLGTALLVWLIRPGTPGVPGGGGIFNRQPRVTILVILIAAVVAGVVYFVLSRRRPTRLGARGSIAVGTAVVVLLGVLVGIFWPGGVIRHWPKQPKVTTPINEPVTNPPVVSSTVPKTATTKPPTATTVPKSATTVTTTPQA